MFPGQTQNLMYGYSETEAVQDRQIDADEMQRCLTQMGIAGEYQALVNLDTCWLMVSMPDRDMSGTICFSEFKELQFVLNG